LHTFLKKKTSNKKQTPKNESICLIQQVSNKIHHFYKV
jgi:hypothetical protein